MTSVQTDRDLFWADAVARSLPPDRPHVVHDSKTPSGTVPVSGLRGPVISDALYRTFRASGLHVRFLYGIDDMDPMDAQSMRSSEAMAANMGRPLCAIPSPDPSASDYAAYHSSRFLSTFADLGIHPEVYRMRDLYRDGRLDGQIDLVLRRADRVREVYRAVARVVRPDDWLPLQVICENCGRVGTTYARDYDGETVAYECLRDRAKLGRDEELALWAEGCGHQGRVSPFGGRAKLPWNLEWCAQWDIFGVTFEEAGKDLMTAGGSRERSNALFTAVWEKQPPAGLAHEFINVGGRKMGSSTGIGTAAHELVEVYPGEVIRFLMLRTRPQTAIDFDPGGNSLPRLMDEYDRCADAYIADPESDLAKIWALSQLSAEPEPIAFRVRFSLVADWVQLPHIDPERETESRKGSPLNEREARDLARRAALAKTWLERWAPDEARFSVAAALPETAKGLGEAQRAFLASVADEVPRTREPEEMQARLYDLAKDCGLVTADGKVSREAFAAIYRAFLGRPSGPRAAWFLTALDPAFAVARLREAAGR
ncbi:MAG: lysine--tRNA ligase [Chloroflexota bacterium]|nr:lysine--tRNA ligase [Chloroflexota bacterium]